MRQDRGKRTDSKEWVYGDCVRAGNKAYIFQGQLDAENGLPTFTKYEVIPETVGRCIELNDKHDNPIFEGDVVTSRYGDRAVIFGKIGYDSCWCGVKGFVLNNYYDDREDCYELDRSLNLEREEVVGNIYDGGKKL